LTGLALARLYSYLNKVKKQNNKSREIHVENKKLWCAGVAVHRGRSDRYEIFYESKINTPSSHRPGRIWRQRSPKQFMKTGECVE
jgi:hypothetical protein